MTEITAKKKLPAAVERFILHWGDMGDEWGVNRSVSQIHGLLYLAEEPMTAEDIAEVLGMARSNVSNSIKELLSWGLIRRVPILGDRRDHFEAETDIWEVAAKIAAGRKARDQSGREQAAEGDARFHRAGRPLVLADAQGAATARGCADQARREDRQLPAGEIQIGEELLEAYHGVSKQDHTISLAAGSQRKILRRQSVSRAVAAGGVGTASCRDVAALLEKTRPGTNHRLCRRDRGSLL
jgi:DNA-binding MarR family transcriptional regulator